MCYIAITVIVSTLDSCVFTIRVAFLNGIQVVHNISEHWLLYVEAKCTRYMIQPVALFYGPTWQQLYNYVDLQQDANTGIKRAVILQHIPVCTLTLAI